jgi:non-lysosomal glucosylceramidase
MAHPLRPHDPDGADGLLDGRQHNTLDAEWFGKVHCLNSLYLAALRAGEAMARRGATRTSPRAAAAC